jgi:hypothetical protein
MAGKDLRTVKRGIGLYLHVGKLEETYAGKIAL